MVLCYRGRARRLRSTGAGGNSLTLGEHVPASKRPRTMIPIRDDTPRFSTPYVTYFLISLNLLIYLFESALTPESLKILLSQLGMVPANLTRFLAGSGDLGLVAVLLPSL